MRRSSLVPFLGGTLGKSRYRPTAATLRPPYLQVLRQLTREHYGALAQRGKELLDRVGEFSWDQDLRELSCPVAGSGPQPYTVYVRMLLPDEGGPDMDVVCDCPASSEAALCKHTFAALRRLEARLAAADDPLLAEVLGEVKPQAWKVVLQEIDRVLAAPPEPEVAATPKTRIVWRVDASVSQSNYAGRGVLLRVLPYEQKISKRNGQWTSGREIDVMTFAAHPDSWTCEADQRIAAALLRGPLGNRYSYAFDGWDQAFAILGEMVGHPHVYWEGNGGAKIEVQSGQAGLFVEEVDDRLRLRFAIDGEPATPGSLGVVSSDRTQIANCDKQANRIHLCRTSSQAVKLIQQIVTDPPTFGPDGREELLRRLPALESQLPVRLPDSLLAGAHEPDRRIVVRLAPIEPRGLTIAMNVCPAPDGLLFDPGIGRPQITHHVDGQWIVIPRDLEDEQRRAGELAQMLALGDEQQVRPWRWKITDDEQALDVVAQLQELPTSEVLVQWPEGARLWVTRDITPQSLRVQIDDRKDWFGLSGSVDVDGQQLPLGDVLAALRSGKRYLAIGKNKWVRIAQMFRDRLAALDDVVHAGRHGLEVDITAAPVLEELLDDRSMLKACAAWKDMLKRLDEAADLNPDPPITLQAKLRDYQVDGYRWLRRLAAWGVGACLADDMGLGKTVQTLAVLIDRMEEGPTLVLAPTSVCFNWTREIERFAPTLQPVLYRETDRDEVLAALGEGDVVIVSYGLLLRDAEKLAKVPWGTLVLDEAQKIKNSQTKTAQEVRKLEAKWRVALTGTPVENHLGELWSIFRAICPGLFGSWERFRERFAEPIERRRDANRRHALSRVVRPFVLRRAKSEVLEELPPRTEIRRTAELSADERRRYEDARLSAVAQLAGITEQSDCQDRRFEVLAALTRLRQLACHPRLVDAAWNGSSAKLDLLLEIVEELREANHRALVFSQFVQHLTLIREALDLRGIKYQYLDGQTPAAEREKRIDAFQRSEGDLFLISLKAGGTGLNLTAADYVIHMDPWWNPAVEDQATDRAHRIGQTRPVTVYRLVAAGTIEEQILELHADKRHLVSGVLDGTDQAAKLSTQDLVSLIRGGERDDAAERPPVKATKGRARGKS